MISLGYYAKDANGTLFQFEWVKDLFNIFVEGVKTPANKNDFEILEIGFFTANDANLKTKT